jgi:hypothetical protein
MGRPTKMSVQKRQRERKKSEAAELKREAQRGRQGTEKPAGGQVAERSDLEGYGVIPTFSDD